jgi:hypothetical protein
MAKLFTDGYAVLETNLVSAVRTGQIIAQFPMTAGLLAAGAENGMLLTVDFSAKKVGFPTDVTSYVYLHASEEMIYEDHLGRNGFILKKDIPPKMLKLTYGDIFETNAIDGGTYNLTTAKAAVAGGLYGVPDATGFIKLVNAAGMATAKVVLKVVEFVTLPSGSTGIQFAVEKA